ncbi:hypothetical protein [Filimonas effusa]|uniref:Uncharacterized protein n=1 Tax=Filimonas effusa TaxID=2508721 RepID=A0A4Q1D0V0_9BACT|nr:hypothetical protein [Filimonas effusa]RXK80536.1 hypothetical protein ESB13_23155 [Filimonas effusa]
MSNQRDIKDSEKDQKKMEPEMSYLDLPEVKDIPGQENVRPAPLGGIGDMTASSADEEGKRVLDREEDELDETDVTEEERELLRETAESGAGSEDLDVRRARLDNTDDDGDPLNESEGHPLSGRDLDVPGSDDDDDMEDIGEEDEENNAYSISGNDGND